MSEIITSLRHRAPLPDSIASIPTPPDTPIPDLKGLHLKVESLQRQVELQHDSLLKLLDAFRTETYSRITSLRSGQPPEDFRYFLRSLPDERLATVEAR